ncbi:hypothetical protein IJL65_00730 [bacterium]|nr:hypothetical protein [bacterium]
MNKKDIIKFNYSMMNNNNLFHRNGSSLRYSIDESVVFMDVYCPVSVGYIVSMYSEIMREGFVEKMIYSRFNETNKFKNIFC